MRLAVLQYCLIALCCACSFAGAAELSWSGFRGLGDSHSTEPNLPLTWSDTQNVAWKKDLPGAGQSSPVVWKDLIFVTSVGGDNKEKLQVTCLKVDSGDIVWAKEFPNSKPEKATEYISRAAPTPVVDADRVYAFFESGDILTLNHKGETVWTRSLAADYGPFKGNHGLGSSLAQTDDAIIVLADHDGPSYLLSLDKATGKTVWKKDRESRVSWSSPIVTTGPEGPEILVSSNGVVQSMAAKTGDLLWEVTALKGNTVASPSVTEQGVVVGSSQPGDNLLIRRGGKGNVTGTHIAWRAEGVSSSFGSPVVNGGRAFFVSKAKVLFAVDMEKGTTLWNHRLPDSTWASPIAVGDRIYFFCNDGTTIVIKSANEYDQLAENKLTVDDKIYGVAVTHGGFVIRNGSRLTFVQEKPAAK